MNDNFAARWMAILAERASRIEAWRVSQGLLRSGGEPIYVEDFVVEVWRLQAAGRDADARRLLLRVWSWGIDGMGGHAVPAALRLFERCGFATDDEQAWATLPERLTVYRAESGENRSRGFCWTLDRDVAEIHATRHGLDLSIGVIAKRDALAYITGYGEEEIVVRREHVDAW